MNDDTITFIPGAAVIAAIRFDSLEPGNDAAPRSRVFGNPSPTAGSFDLAAAPMRLPTRRRTGGRLRQQGHERPGAGGDPR